MKKLLTEIYVMLIIVLITASLGTFPATYAAQSTAQDQAMAFIENALPVDLSKYNMTLTKHTKIDALPIGGVLDRVRYTLASDESTFDVLCNVQNNVVIYCQVTAKNGSIISDKQYVNLIDAVKSFLEKYQSYTKIASSNMIDMLDNIDATKNSTITIGNTKLAISNVISAGDELTIFNWAYTINGANYTSLQVGFQKNGIRFSLR